jgi:hypothetical protein
VLPEVETVKEGHVLRDESEAIREQVGVGKIFLQRGDREQEVVGSFLIIGAHELAAGQAIVTQGSVETAREGGEVSIGELGREGDQSLEEIDGSLHGVQILLILIPGTGEPPPQRR